VATCSLPLPPLPISTFPGMRRDYGQCAANSFLPCRQLPADILWVMPETPQQEWILFVLDTMNLLVLLLSWGPVVWLVFNIYWRIVHWHDFHPEFGWSAHGIDRKVINSHFRASCIHPVWSRKQAEHFHKLVQENKIPLRDLRDKIVEDTKRKILEK